MARMPTLPVAPKRIFSGPISPEEEDRQRALVVREALSWVGTPYRQLGASKGGNIDCAMLLVRVWVEAGIVEEFDPRPYHPEWYLHHPEEIYLQWMSAMAEETSSPRPGDIVLFHFGRCFSHGGILVSPDVIVHAWVEEGFCTMSELRLPVLCQIGRGRDPKPRPRKFFDVWKKMRAS